MAIKSSPVSGLDVYTRVLACTPSDTTTYGYNAPTPSEDICALWVGTVGNVAITDKDGNVTTILNVQSGTLLKISPQKVMATNTTATNIMLFFW